MDQETNATLTFDPTKLAYWSIILATLVTFLVVAKPLLIPLAIAFLFWALLDAIRNFLLHKTPAKWRMNSKLATLAAIAIIAVGNTLFVMILVGQAEALNESLPAYEEKLTAMLPVIAQTFGLEQLPTAESMLAKLDVSAAVTWVGGAAGTLMGNLGLIALYVGFMLAEEKIMAEKLRRFSSNRDKSRRMVDLSGEINGRIQLYIGMKTVVSALTGMLGYLLLRWVGVDFAALWGLLIFLLNFIPNVGSMIGVAFPALLTLIQFDGYTTFLVVTVGLVLINFFVGNIIEPAYMGRSLNLSPLMILLSLSLWGAIWGLAGMLLSVPLMVVTAIICSHFKGLSWISVLLSADGGMAHTEH